MAETTGHPGVSKVVYAGETLIDLTEDTVEADYLLAGFTAHGRDGAVIVGECTFNQDTSDANVKASEILSGKIAYTSSGKVTGTMPNKTKVTGTIDKKDGVYTIPQGYHDGSGTVAISSTEKSKIVATNIRQGVTILGVSGSMTGTESAKAQSKTVTPSKDAQIVTPDANDGYNYLSQVTIEAIPVTRSSNTSGGTTVSIG